MMMPGLGVITKSLFDAQPTPLKPTRDPSDADPAATADLVNPSVAGGVFVAGKGKVIGNTSGRQLWRFANLFSRGIGTITGWDRAFAVWSDPRPFATQGEEFFYSASGLRPMVQPTKTEVRRLRGLEDEFKLKGQTKDIEKLIKGR